MHTTRRPAALLTAAALLLTAGTACTSNSEPDAEPKPSKSASPETRFLTAVHDADLQSWTDTRPSDNELAEYPPQWCAELDAGHSVAYLFDDTDGAGLYPIGVDWGTKQADANELLVLGVTAYCPEHRGQVTEELREDGGY